MPTAACAACFGRENLLAESLWRTSVEAGAASPAQPHRVAMRITLRKPEKLWSLGAPCRYGKGEDVSSHQPQHERHVNTPSYVLVSRVRMTDTGGQWSFVVHPANGDEPFEAADFEPGATRERLELLAIVRALEALEQPSHVTLCCESPHLFRRIGQGLDEWRDAGWQWEAFGEMVSIANADLWRRVDRAIRIHKVECRRTPPAFRQPFAGVNERLQNPLKRPSPATLPRVNLHRQLAATA